MRKISVLFVSLFLFSVHAQVLRQADADAKVKGANEVWMDNEAKFPQYVSFRPDARISSTAFVSWAKENLRMNANDELRQVKSNNDQIGFVHNRYQQFHSGIKVLGGIYDSHSRNGSIESVNGEYFEISASSNPAISSEAALEIAKQWMNADQFAWEVPVMEAQLKVMKGNPAATYFPTAELIYSPTLSGNALTKEYHLAWGFNLYSTSPLKRFDVYVDAQSGEVIFTNDLLHSTDVNGTAHTRYSGVRTIVTDSTGPTTFRLRESGRGDGIFTLDANGGTNEGSAVNFTDTNNDWNNINADEDEAATDAHWAAEMTYDFYDSTFNRKSFDDDDAAIYSYVHWDNNLLNAFFDGEGMHFGDGSGSYDPFTALDVVAHEFTHGVTGTSAGLYYLNESGALNESFSDIFGQAVENYAKPADFNWKIGEDMHAAGLRDMSNPNSMNNPSDYLGSHWYTGTDDNGGVHINSGVQNYWFYLVTDGGSGTNENGEAFSVTGIGIDKATAIAYRSLTVYLHATHKYEQARFYSIKAAVDLYGECSPEMIAVMNAWHACSLGGEFTATPVSDFFAAKTSYCVGPAAVQFTNQSTNAISWTWQFGDGSSSTALNPLHTYSFYNTYTVKLIVHGCSTDVDTLVRPDYIVVDNTIDCEIFMPTGTDSTNACSGVLMDCGGNQDYNSSHFGIYTIAPTNASSVQLNFVSFDYMTAGDYVAIYDGHSVSAPLIGIFNGNTLPNGGTITSTGSALTVKEVTNAINNKPGFEASWSCVVGVNDPSTSNGMEVYPNPAKDVFFVKFNQRGEVNLKLVSMLGAVVLEQKHNAGNSIEVNVSTLPAGVYLLKAEQNGSVNYTKIVVE